MIDTIFRKQIARGTLIVYIDDIAVHTKRKPEETKEQHLARHQELVKEMLTILRNNNLYLNIDKCQFKKTKVDYLGVRVGGKEIQMEEAKVEKVRGWKPLQNTTEVQHFLEFTGYYHYFIKGYSQIAQPLLDLTKQSTKWHWGMDQQKAFDELRTRMCNKLVLMNPDPTKVF
jgi:hypothetical protein